MNGSVQQRRPAVTRGSAWALLASLAALVLLALTRPEDVAPVDAAGASSMPERQRDLAPAAAPGGDAGGAAAEPVAPEVASETPRRQVAHATSGVVSGRVRIASSGADCAITVLLERTGSDGRILRRSAVARVEKGTGTFVMAALPLDPAAGKLTATWSGRTGASAFVTVDTATPEVDVDLDFIAGSDCMLSVRDEDDLVVEGLDVALEPLGAPAGRPPHVASTDSHGLVRFAGVMEGEYRVLFGKGVRLLMAPGSLQVPPPVAGSPCRGAYVVPRRHVVSIAVRDVDGHAIPGVRITASHRDSPNELLGGSTDDRGRLALGGLFPGRYRVRAECPGFTTAEHTIAWQRGQAAAPVTVVLGRSPVGR